MTESPYEILSRNYRECTNLTELKQCNARPEVRAAIDELKNAEDQSTFICGKNAYEYYKKQLGEKEYGERYGG